MPLDVGRKRRLHPEYQRLAILIRDRGCRAEGCDRRTGLHTHHTNEWAKGGTTNVEDGISLCPWHHHRAHDTSYVMTESTSGKVTFHRRQ